MTDYSSLKVVDLKKALKERSLPVSGNKADLVKRLEDADEAEAATESVKEPPESYKAQQKPEINQDESQEQVPVEQETLLGPSFSTDEATPARARVDHLAVEAIAEPVPETIATSAEPNSQTNAVGAVESDVPASAEISFVHVDATNDSIIEVVDAQPENAVKDADLQAIGTTGKVVDAIQRSSPVLEPVAQMNQSQRRKRSRTPVPIESDVQKKLKTADGAVTVTLPEDVGARSLVAIKTRPASGAADEDDINENEPDANHLAEAATFDPQTAKEVPDEASTPTPRPQSSPVENRSAVSSRTRPESRGSEKREESRVALAKHPPTSVVYIRNLKRPLQPAGLRKHLDILAGGDGMNSSNLLRDFFLDSLRTHCFAQFDSPSTAGRVRDSLHGTAWPDEKSCEELWVDFIPEAKFAEWVKIEEALPTGQKRWWVDYRIEGEGTTVTLRDEGASQREPPLKIKPAKEQTQPKAPPRDDRAKGFQTLDDLFRGTAAKPKLYFLPVSADIANRRMKMLAAGRGGGRGDGDAKYTFEGGDKLVTQGPDKGLVLDRHRGFVGGLPRTARAQERIHYGRHRY